MPKTQVQIYVTVTVNLKQLRVCEPSKCIIRITPALKTTMKNNKIRFAIWPIFTVSS